MKIYGKKSFQSIDTTKITNAVDAQTHVLGMCLEINGKHDSQWCRDYFTATFPRLTKCTIGRVLLGLEPRNERSTGYMPRPF